METSLPSSSRLVWATIQNEYSWGMCGFPSILHNSSNWLEAYHKQHWRESLWLIFGTQTNIHIYKYKEKLSAFPVQGVFHSFFDLLIERDQNLQTAVSAQQQVSAILCVINRFFSSKCVSGGTRTHNLRIRSPTRYPLRHRDMWWQTACHIAGRITCREEQVYDRKKSAWQNDVHGQDGNPSHIF